MLVKGRCLIYPKIRKVKEAIIENHYGIYKFIDLSGSHSDMCLNLPPSAGIGPPLTPSAEGICENYGEIPQKITRVIEISF
jgi:hypothetical protein